MIVSKVYVVQIVGIDFPTGNTIIDISVIFLLILFIILVIARIYKAFSKNNLVLKYLKWVITCAAIIALVGGFWLNADSVNGGDRIKFNPEDVLKQMSGEYSRLADMKDSISELKKIKLFGIIVDFKFNMRGDQNFNKLDSLKTEYENL